MLIADYTRHQHITDTSSPDPGEFSFKPPTMAVELAIGKARSKHASDIQKHPGRLLAHVLAVSLDTLHGNKLDSMDGHQARVDAIMRVPYTDVMTMHIKRGVIKARGAMKVQGIQCPHCGRENAELTLDLTKIEVGEIKAKSVEVPIVEPVQLGKENLEKLTLRVPTFGESFAAMSAEDADNPTAVGMLLMAAAVAPVPRNVLFQLHPADFERLERAMDDLGGGPVLSVPVTCSYCEKIAHVPYNWQADFS